MLWSLFLTFFKIGLISFGGGYAMIPIIQHEVSSHHWLSDKSFADAVALAGMAPGPIATNTATLIGYKTAGVPGAAISTLGMVLPSLLLMILITAYFYKVSRTKWVKSSFYGLRPIVTGLIIYAAIHFGFSGMGMGSVTWKTLLSLLITCGVVIGVMKYKLHPMAALLLSGLVGVVFFQ
ncbi:chromate transporter [Gordoniibacillus kamchatkensis]|uniref:Chromate transporter n=1 Tax=Gordoniibacillus kamchatkensis TaxID=1590651 RepID=A0ABR5AJ45_9BACL|nr:chromate transporter [Paenibacillus sp. VKM B-2647]KIL40377.1 chromate transporter [Paenibacillus sp. VKM B-2647]